MSETEGPGGAMPRHVAFIMDGNGRWAAERGLPRALGHQAGAETVRRVVAFARKRGIPYLTLYAFSTENWSRPPEEVDALMGLLASFIESETPALMDKDIRLRILGDPGGLPGQVAEALAEAVARTSGNRSLNLALAINYGGRDEILRAARMAASRLVGEGREPGEMKAADLAACLDTREMPDPDLLVRTAGEQRLSNFLLWQAAYAELYFTAREWPDFSEADFEQALVEYSGRKRKFGGV